ncbi:MAG TPA: cupredoxin domain-containing protein [Frankiaceae bacterium]|nr:cupredoxin domain-containing protein [Frankiaceae bacterium]
MRLLLALAALALTPVPANAAPIQVDMLDNRFTPRSATVSVGDRVTWKNIGKAPHEVTAPAFKSGNVDAGKSWSWTATTAGTFSYVCKYHEAQGMTATLAVNASPARSTGLPNTGGDRVALGLLVLGFCAIAGASLRYGWRAR